MNKTGVLLINLGTPKTPDAKGVRDFLRSFLSDRRVVDIPPLLWLPILYGIILPLRAPKIAPKYQLLWEEFGDSPLRVFSQSQVKKLQTAYNESGENYCVTLGMTYGDPSIADAVADLKQKGCSKIIVLPLFPQYSLTTTAAVEDQLNRVKQQHNDVRFQLIPFYYNAPVFIEALKDSVKAQWQKNGRGEYLLFSFHGIPKRNVTVKSDPYQKHCEATAEAVAKSLNLTKEQWSVSYQSRFGKAEWLSPDTSVVIAELPNKNIKNIDVICPSFSVDCLETIEEINIENRKIFLDANGEKMNVISCLNDSDSHIKMMKFLIDDAINDKF